MEVVWARRREVGETDSSIQAHKCFLRRDIFVGAHFELVPDEVPLFGTHDFTSLSDDIPMCEPTCYNNRGDGRHENSSVSYLPDPSAPNTAVMDLISDSHNSV